MATKHVTTGMIGQLRRDARGNIMYLTAGLLIPMIATIGAGVDLGQAYMAKSRLQQACDAGVLAGRKSMAEGLFDSDAATAARNMFNTNYPTGIYDSTGVTFTPSARGTSEVTGSATATIRTIIMKIFGKETFNLAVNCTAKLEISNADIMFVLDVTGSMSATNSGDSVNRITALKTETVAFFDTLMTAARTDSRIRIGVVPYSSNINVGSILTAANPDFLADTVTVPSRVPNYNYVQDPDQTTYQSPQEFITSTGTYANQSPVVYTTGLDAAACVAQTPPPDNNQVAVGSPTEVLISDVTTNGTRVVTTQIRQNYTRNTYQFNYNSSNGRCRTFRADRNLYTLTNELVTTPAPRAVFKDYTYRLVDYNVRDFVRGTALQAPVGTNGTAVTAAWQGCIIESNTVAFDDAVATIPTGANDLNISLVPSTDAERWKPIIANFMYARSWSMNNSQSGSPASLTTSDDYTAMTSDYTCPAAAQKLTPYTTANRTSFVNYINTLSPTGTTYHDSGMTWGARLISPTGIFGTENSSAPNGSPISRHIIFMTDGEPNPDWSTLSFQSYEPLQPRIGTTDSSEKVRRHNRRFRAICDAAKAQNITIWTVSFGTTLTNEMRNCASGDKAYQANNAAQLRTQFQAIAQQITRLRLSE